MFLPTLLACAGGLGTGTTDTAIELPPLDRETSVDDLIFEQLMGLKGSRSEAYEPPDDADLANLRELLPGALALQPDRGRLISLGYDLTRIETDSRRVFVVRELDNRGRAALLFDPEASSSLIVEAPHIGFETDIYLEAGAVFQTTGARALLLNGAHRCANEAPSGCDGTTEACGDPDWYRVSDAAHNCESNFQVMHEVVAETFADDLVVSLHGFGWDEGDPVALVSDGTENTDPESIGARFADELDARFPEGFRAASCNRSTDVGVARLCGTTNTQGRHLNGSDDPCNSAASSASGRFLHLEQSLDLRRTEGEVHRGQVIDALRAVLPE